LRPDRRSQGLGLQRDRSGRRGGQARRQRTRSRNDAARAGTGAVAACFDAGARDTSARAGSAEVERASGLPARGHSEHTASDRAGCRVSRSGRVSDTDPGCAACRGASCAGKSFQIIHANPDCGATVDVFRRSANGDSGSAAERGCFQRAATGSANGRAADTSCSRTATGSCRARSASESRAASTSRSRCAKARSCRTTTCFGCAGDGDSTATGSGRADINTAAGARSYRRAAAARSRAACSGNCAIGSGRSTTESRRGHTSPRAGEAGTIRAGQCPR
jgi:hypothetical protein